MTAFSPHVIPSGCEESPEPGHQKIKLNSLKTKYYEISGVQVCLSAPGFRIMGVKLDYWKADRRQKTMAKSGKSRSFVAETEVSAIQTLLRDWVAKNPDNAELQQFKEMRAGRWDNRTNELFTRYLISTQTNQDKAGTDTRRDGWLGAETKETLEKKDPAMAKAIADLQKVGKDQGFGEDVINRRLHHRTESHPAPGHEIDESIAGKLPLTPAFSGEANKTRLSLTTVLGEDGMPTDSSPGSADALGPKLVGGLAGAGILAGTSYAGWKAFGARNAFNPPAAPAALPNPAPASTPRLNGPSATSATGESAPRPAAGGVSEKPGAATPRTGASVTAASEAAAARNGASTATKALVGELMPKGNLPTPTERLVNGTSAASEPLRTPGAATPLNTLATASQETSFLKNAWSKVGNFAQGLGRGLGYVGLAVAPVEALATTEGSLGDKTLAAGKSMVTPDYLLGGAMVLGSAPVAVPAAAGLGLKMAWAQGLEDRKADLAALAEKTRPAEERQATIIGTMREKSDFATELAVLNDSKPYGSDEEAAKLLKDETFFKKVHDHYNSKLKADTAAGRSEDAGKAQWILAGLNHFREAESQRVAIVREHEGPVKAAADPRQQAIPVYDML